MGRESGCDKQVKRGIKAEREREVKQVISEKKANGFIGCNKRE